MNLSDFDFSVPAELIAKHPLKKRDECRLLVLEKKIGRMAHRQFSDLLEYLQPGDVLVLNDAKVNKSRFFATRPTSLGGLGTGGGKVEVLLTRPASLPQGECHSPLQRNISPGSVGATGGRPGESKDSPLQKNVSSESAGTTGIRLSSLSLRRRGTEGEVAFVGAGSAGRRQDQTGKPAHAGDERTGLPDLRTGEPAPTKTNNVWEAIISHSSRVKEGEFLTLNGKAEGFKILSRGEGKAEVQVVAESDIFEKYGTIPIPPYLERPAKKEDEEDYQTVFARTPGASAAPTAGLHFTPELLDKIRAKGVEIAYLSLLVGPGTFEPIRGDDFSRHKMHAEYFEIGEETCTKINAAKKIRKKIWAVGTTVVKALETAARITSPSVPLHSMEREEKTVWANGFRRFPPRVGEGLRERSFSADSDLFIHPPFDFKIVDGLITNFHWPRSTLILLVAAFADKDQILSAYDEAITQRYRFFSYGDAMLIY